MLHDEELFATSVFGAETEAEAFREELASSTVTLEQRDEREVVLRRAAGGPKRKRLQKKLGRGEFQIRDVEPTGALAELVEDARLDGLLEDR